MSILFSVVYNFKRIYTYSILLKTVDKTGLKETWAVIEVMRKPVCLAMFSQPSQLRSNINTELILLWYSKLPPVLGSESLH